MLGIFDSHPVQYRAPLYRELQRLVPGAFHVFYATDNSLTGRVDPGFGRKITWDEDLLQDYPSTVLHSEHAHRTGGALSLTGHGVAGIFKSHRFTAVLQTQWLYTYDWRVLWEARRRGIPVWVRQETQDEAFRRGWLKSVVRSLGYRVLYSQVAHAFAIGQLNRSHLLLHGIPARKISMTHYCTLDRFETMGVTETARLGSAQRELLGIEREDLVIGFFGKLIPKKNPALLIDAIRVLESMGKRRLCLLFVGSGKLEGALREQAELLAQRGVRVIFAGFVNQSGITPFYAATDILVLPSDRMGETWGLVVNEALQAGCSVVISSAAGCHVEFGDWPHCKVFSEGDAGELVESILHLADHPPANRLWCRPEIDMYSMKAAAKAIARMIAGAAWPELLTP